MNESVIFWISHKWNSYLNLLLFTFLFQQYLEKKFVRFQILNLIDLSEIIEINHDWSNTLRLISPLIKFSKICNLFTDLVKSC